MDLGMSGLMIETHHNPSVALSDAAQQLLPADLIRLLDNLTIRDLNLDQSQTSDIRHLRIKMDSIDEQLVELLSGRMNVARAIGDYKKEQISLGNGEKLKVNVNNNGKVNFGLRPEDFTLDENGPIKLKVELVELIGANTLINGKLENSDEVLVASISGVINEKKIGKNIKKKINLWNRIIIMPLMQKK